MELRVKVRCDGNHFIAHLPSPKAGRPGRGRSPKTWKDESFDRYYAEAMEQGMTPGAASDHVVERFREEYDVKDWISDEESMEQVKSRQRNLHKRKKRFRDKLFLVDWNYFVTFTYDDAKETEAGFDARLRKTFSNLKCRYGWLIMAVPEEGAENGRKHYHALVYVPPGAMRGELVTRRLWSKKKKRWSFFTDNTYFSERFGYSVWKPVNRSDLRGNSLSRYLTKYLEKSGNRFFYSRGIPGELDMIIDTDTDIFATFYHYGVKAMLHDSFFYDGLADTVDQSQLLHFKSWELPGYDPDVSPTLGRRPMCRPSICPRP